MTKYGLSVFENKIEFESALAQLEKIVEKLEDENLSLEDSIKSFETGVKLVKDCQNQLRDAELKVSKLMDSGEAIESEQS